MLAQRIAARKGGVRYHNTGLLIAMRKLHFSVCDGFGNA
jgi:hypothetical protein